MTNGYLGGGFCPEKWEFEQGGGVGLPEAIAQQLQVIAKMIRHDLLHPGIVHFGIGASILAEARADPQVRVNVNHETIGEHCQMLASILMPSDEVHDDATVFCVQWKVPGQSNLAPAESPADPDSQAKPNGKAHRPTCPLAVHPPQRPLLAPRHHRRIAREDLFPGVALDGELEVLVPNLLSDPTANVATRIVPAKPLVILSLETGSFDGGNDVVRPAMLCQCHR